MDVYISDQQTDLVISSLQVESLVKELIKFEAVKCDEVSVQFVDTESICSLHELYFNDPSVTDCISFPIDDEVEAGYFVLGEVVVCPKTALDYVKKNDGDPYWEVSLYLVHGLLHLIGYDDIGDKEWEMRQAEKRVMNHLKHKNLLLKEEFCTS